MRYDQVRDALLRQWKYTGGPNEGDAAEVRGDLPAHIRGRT
jgi:hypothetical protein